ncbi:MAG TPA: NUDIX hydrolase [Pyrinomonadaceae bacterium]|jgi:8-oxo-dGTP pyrophosphatase MutT (NUDIX family)|nr:NUDIX hydrolase [Pyrinomonadaceae bacterium]
MTTIFAGKYFSILTDSDGTEFVQAGDEVLVVALAEHDEVLLIKEPSPAFGVQTLVLPGGSVEEDEDLSITANRELQEEVGLRAAQLDYLGELRPFSKYLAVRSHVYLARQLASSALKGDENYEIEVSRVSLRGFEAMIEDRRLMDARVIAALHLARAFMNLEAG